jgi:hypothetical protein
MWTDTRPVSQKIARLQQELEVESKGFWRWSMTLRTTRFVDVVHDLLTVRKYSISSGVTYFAH